MASELKIKLVRSTIGRSQKQKRTAEALGFKKLNQVVVHKDNPAIRGMVDRIKHLVEVSE